MGYRESTDLDLTPTWKVKVNHTEHPWLKGHNIWVRNWTPLAYNLLKGHNVGILGTYFTATALGLDVERDDLTMGELYDEVKARLDILEKEIWWPEQKRSVVKVKVRPAKPITK